MKERIEVTLVALLILCLALAGCGQRGSNANDLSNHVTTSEEKVEESTAADSAVTTEVATTAEADGVETETTETSAETETETEAETSAETETETNPSNGDSGMYTYELHGGITISCHTNVWDYINGNSFDFRAMAHDLGWTIDYNDMPQCNMFSKNLGDDIAVCSGITAKYDYKGDNYPLVGIARVLPGGVVKELFIYYYYDSNNIYTINGSGPTLSFDAIPVIAFLFENYSLENEDPVIDIFANYKVPKEEKTSTWKDYRLP